MPSTASDAACASMDAQVLSNWLEGPAAMRPTTPAPQLPLSITRSTQPDLSQEDIASLLSAFDVDIHHGFIPSPDPLTSLPMTSKFAPWERLMLDLSMRLHAHNIRQAVLQLPLIQVTEEDLPTPPELRRAQLVLSMLAHSFVWGEEPVVSRLPAAIAVPWVAVSHRLGRVAVLTHSAIILSNWKRLDPKGPIRLHNVGLLNGFYGGIDEAIFYLVTLEVEAVGAPALAHMVQSQHYARTQQWTKLTAELRQVASFLPKMTAAVMLTYTDCDPYIFYTRVRKFLQGWRGNPLIPEGMIYEGVSDSPQLFHGGSAAQSCILAVFDSFLSVQHEREQTRQFMRDMRFYMPGLHRHFLNFIDTNISVRQAIATALLWTSIHNPAPFAVIPHNDRSQRSPPSRTVERPLLLPLLSLLPLLPPLVRLSAALIEHSGAARPGAAVRLQLHRGRVGGAEDEAHRYSHHLHTHSGAQPQTQNRPSTRCRPVPLPLSLSVRLPLHRQPPRSCNRAWQCRLLPRLPPLSHELGQPRWHQSRRRPGAGGH